MSDNKNLSLVERMAQRFGVEPRKFFDTLKSTAFKQRDGSAPSDEQMMALMVVAEQYGLNPFTKEIYAFPDKQNGIIPVVGVDGWSRIINEHPHYDGIEFVYSEKMVAMPGARVPCPEWIECVIYRKDRSRPTRIKEFADEVYRPPFEGNGRNGSYTIEGPWQTHTKRQIRHKALIQCSRVAFGFSGIYDQDEAERIQEMKGEIVVNPVPQSAAIAPQAQPQPVLELALADKERLAPFLKKLASRALQQNAWSAAEQYVEERFKGAEKDHALQFLTSFQAQENSTFVDDLDEQAEIEAAAQAEINARNADEEAKAEVEAHLIAEAEADMQAEADELKRMAEVDADEAAADAQYSR